MSVIINGQVISKNQFIVNPSIVTNGLIVHFDIANSKSYTSTGSTINDLSGYRNNGTLFSGVSYDSANKGSLVFNGNAFVSINDTVNLNLSIFTYCGWLYNSAGTLLWNRVMSKKLNYTDLNGYEISLATGTDTTLYIGGSSATFATIPVVTSWINTGWHYLVVIFSGSTVYVYFDNVYKNQGSIASIVSNTRPLYLGKIAGEDTTLWNGKMSNISIYNRALNISEISQNYNTLKSRYI
jgi:hypothetical protein